MGYLDRALKEVRRAERNVRLMVEANQRESAMKNLALLEQKVSDLRNLMVGAYRADYSNSFRDPAYGGLPD